MLLQENLLEYYNGVEPLKTLLEATNKENFVLLREHLQIVELQKI